MDTQALFKLSYGSKVASSLRIERLNFPLCAVRSWVRFALFTVMLMRLGVSGTIILILAPF